MVLKPESLWDGMAWVFSIFSSCCAERLFASCPKGTWKRTTVTWVVHHGGSQLGVLFVGIAGNVHHLWTHRNPHIRTPCSGPSGGGVIFVRMSCWETPVAEQMPRHCWCCVEHVHISALRDFQLQGHQTLPGRRVACSSERSASGKI